jgi:16S rRNA (cytosine967-C5)-methyltransferase
LVYITCSVLPEENTAQIERFLEVHKNFEVIPFAKQWAAAIGTTPPKSADGSESTLLLTPAQHGTDGFFIAVMKKN